jgi:GH25 family lysozyme M1 (1,4-beta-N-acetylmuramidase)/peptidoglycan hydrolase CwlO-like protein
MHKTNRKDFNFVPKKALITFLISVLAVFAIELPAQADAISDARAELTATMTALDSAKKTLAAAEKELATAKSLAAKIDKELKAAQAAYAQVKAEMDAMNEKIAQDQAKLDDIVRTAYKMGVSKEWLMIDVIISSDSDENITSKLELLNQVLDSSNDILAVLIQEKAALEIKVKEAEIIQAEIKVKSDESIKVVAELAVKTQKAKDEANRVQTLANDKEAVLRKLVFAGLPTTGTMLGADISYAQHPGNAPIDFIKMYDAGIRFLYMKGSSGGDAPNAQAMRWSLQDFPKAREAGILVGIYHAAGITAGSSPDSAAAQGVAQANRAVGNMNALGGYKPGVLPIALDVEGFSLFGGPSTPASVVTAFTVAFVSTVKAQTGRTPVIYSNLSFLKQYLTDPALKNYPLWVANLTTGSNPGALTNGTCLPTVWTSSGCVLDWTFWQYTHSAPAANYGIARGLLDLNRLGKSVDTLLALANY